MLMFDGTFINKMLSKASKYIIHTIQPILIPALLHSLLIIRPFMPINHAPNLLISPPHALAPQMPLSGVQEETLVLLERILGALDPP